MQMVEVKYHQAMQRVACYVEDNELLGERLAKVPSVFQTIQGG